MQPSESAEICVLLHTRSDHITISNFVCGSVCLSLFLFKFWNQMKKWHIHSVQVGHGTDRKRKKKKQKQKMWSAKSVQCVPVHDFMLHIMHLNVVYESKDRKWNCTRVVGVPTYSVPVALLCWTNAAKELHDDDVAAIGSAPVVCAHDRVQHLNMKWPQRDFFYFFLFIMTAGAASARLSDVNNNQKDDEERKKN